jgi:hypothetical protein
MTIRVVLKEDRQKLGKLFDLIRKGANGSNEEVLEALEFFEANIDDFFVMINRPVAHLWDKTQEDLSATAT